MEGAFVRSPPTWKQPPVSPTEGTDEGRDQGLPQSFLPSSLPPASSTSNYYSWPTIGVAQVENIYPMATMLQREEPWLAAEIEDMPHHEHKPQQQQQQQQHQHQEQVVIVPAQQQEQQEQEEDGGGGEGGFVGDNGGKQRKRSSSRSLCMECLSILTFYQHLILIALTFSLPLLIFLGWTWTDPRARCLYVIAVMVLGWLTNCMDAYAVALFPFLLFPILRVVTTAQVAASYMNSVTFLIVGASMMAAALRRVKLDIAAANWLLKVAPKHPEEIALSLMGASFGVSTCLSNTGTMLIFCPIVDLMVRGLHPDNRSIIHHNNNDTQRSLPPSIPAPGAPTAGSPGEPVGVLGGSLSFTRKQEDGGFLLLEGGRGTVFPHGSCLPKEGGEATFSRQGTRAAEDVLYISPDQINGSRDLLRPGGSSTPAADTNAHGAHADTAAAAAASGGCSSPPSDEVELKAESVHEEDALIPLSDEISHETPQQRRVRNLLFVGSAYAATLGGSATATGSTTNAIFLAVLDAMYSQTPGGSAANPVTYTTWLFVSLPLGLIQLFLVWLSLCLVWMGPRATGAAFVRVLKKCFKAVFTCGCCRRRGGGNTNSDGSTPLSEASTSNRPKTSIPRDGVVQKKEKVEENAANKAHGNNVEGGRGPDGALQQEQHEDNDDLHAARVYVVLSWVLLVCLWLSRRTILPAIPGWGEQWAGFIDDAWPAMLVPMLLWFVPLHPRRQQPSFAKPVLILTRWWRRRRGGRVMIDEDVVHGVDKRGRKGDTTSIRRPFESILTFSVIEKEMDWGLLFLLGSGFVIASVSHACGLDLVMVENMDFMKKLTRASQVACVMGMAALITQITSNTATASIFMPLLATVAKGLPGTPLLLMLAANVNP
ncbi:hypothetical protein ACSSS7_003456 [Eimeria intestinalis]